MSDVAPMLVERPTPPDFDSDEDKMWRKERTLTYTDGYVVALYGNLIQTFNLGQLTSACLSTNVPRKAYNVNRVNKIGEASTPVSYPSATYKRFNRRNASLASAGGIYTFITDIGLYEARVAGDIQHLIDFVCTNRASLYGPLTILSERSAEYGPFNTVI